jgi:LysR family transcriptional regulator for metE and metH
LHAVGTEEMMAKPYAKDLAHIVRDVCAEKLKGIKLL